MKAKRKNPTLPKGVRIDSALDKYNDVVLFPEKLKKANHILKTIGLPKI